MIIPPKAFHFAISALIAASVLGIALALDVHDGYRALQLGSPLFPLQMRSSFTTCIMIVACPLIVGWGASVYRRCSDLQVRWYLMWIAGLCVFWFVTVSVKYLELSSYVASLLWYSYYIPMLALPVLCLYAALHIAFRDSSRIVRAVRVAAAAISALLLIFVFTNNLHHQVFAFDFADERWVSDYAYNWGYWVVYAWAVLPYVAFFALLVRIAHLRLRKMFVPAIVIGLLALVYGALYALRLFDVAAGNFALTYVVMLVVCLELLLRFGLLPSFSGYGQLFEGLPFDVKVVGGDFTVAYQTNCAQELKPEERSVLEEFASSAEGQARFRIAAYPDNSYEAVRQRGSIALYTEDRSAINAQLRKLEEASDALRAHIALLANSVSVQRELYRLSSERKLLDEVDDQLSATVDTICALLDGIEPPGEGDTSHQQEERRRTLVFVRLLIGYCKRMGAFVLADSKSDGFDREHLNIVMGDTAADARASGIECAAFVGADCLLSKHSCMILYSCMYEVLIMAFQFRDAAVMFSVRDHGEEDVEFDAILEAADEKDFAGGQIAEKLRVSLSSYEVPYSIFVDGETLHVAVILPLLALEQARGEVQA